MQSMITRITIPLPMLVLLLLPLQSQAADVLEQLKACARTQDQPQRSQCYEDLGRQVLAADAGQTTDNSAATDGGTDANGAAAQSKPAADTETAKSQARQDNNPQALPDDIGGGKFSDGSDRNLESYTGVLTRCQRASDRKWFYVFDNGQIWKQVDRRKLRHKNCSGTVTIVKDGFGYKMTMDSIKGRIRIRRYK